MLLNQKINTYRNKSLYNNKVHSLYLYQSQEKSYDFNSSNLLITVTTNQSNIDNYGNVGTISVTRPKALVVLIGNLPSAEYLIVVLLLLLTIPLPVVVLLVLFDGTTTKVHYQWVENEPQDILYENGSPNSLFTTSLNSYSDPSISLLMTESVI
jgi:hypothetical protein